jgi:hypothetical protein
MQTFEECQTWERNWWGNCLNRNTFEEIIKQEMYMPAMGLEPDSSGEISIGGKRILDIGGGPVSILLRAKESNKSVVADPLMFPPHVHRRYLNAGIRYLKSRGEVLRAHFTEKFDEVWMYNVLQHSPTPEKILKTARQLGEVIRIFDWVNVGICPGHPSNLTEELFNNGFKGCEQLRPCGVVQIDDAHTKCRGQAFRGVYRSHDPLVPIKTALAICQQQGWEIKSGDSGEISGTYEIMTSLGVQTLVLEDGQIRSLN